MAKRIVAQPPASSQPIPAELEDVLREATDNNVDLVAAFGGVLDAIFESLRDWRLALQQAIAFKLLTPMQSHTLDGDRLERQLNPLVVIWEGDWPEE